MTLASHYAWALWLAAPVVGVVVVSVVVWWWARPARRPTTDASIAGHQAYLDALATPPRERFPAAVPDPDEPDATSTPDVADAGVCGGPSIQ